MQVNLDGMLIEELDRLILDAQTVRAKKVQARREELLAELKRLDAGSSDLAKGGVLRPHPNAGKAPAAKWKWADGEWSGRGQIPNKMWDALGVTASSISREDALKLAEKKGMKV